MFNIVALTVAGSVVTTIGSVVLSSVSLHPVQIAAAYLAGGLVGASVAVMIAERFRAD